MVRYVEEIRVLPGLSLIGMVFNIEVSRPRCRKFKHESVLAALVRTAGP